MLLIGFRNLGREMRVLKVVPRATCRARWLVMGTPAPAPSVRWPEPECRMMHMCGLSHLDTYLLPLGIAKSDNYAKQNTLFTILSTCLEVIDSYIKTMNLQLPV